MSPVKVCNNSPFHFFIDKAGLTVFLSIGVFGYGGRADHAVRGDICDIGAFVFRDKWGNRFPSSADITHIFIINDVLIPKLRTTMKTWHKKIIVID